MYEKESKPKDNLEDLENELRKKGYKIERLEEGDLAQCESEGCFEDAEWFVEGNSYCPKHKRGAIEGLKRIDEEAKEWKKRIRRKGEGLFDSE